MSALKKFLLDLVLGLALGGLMILIPYLKISETGMSMTVLPGTLGEEMFQSLWVMALFCGVFSLGVSLMVKRSAATVIVPAFIMLISYLYFIDGGIVLHGLFIVISWIATVLIIVFGIIPALIIQHFFPQDVIMAVFISLPFGYVVGMILKKLSIGEWVAERRAERRTQKINEKYREEGRKVIKKYGYSSSGSGSYGSDLGTYDSENSYTRGSSVNRDEYGRIVGESETYSDGTTVHRDEYGRIIGESETYSDGTTVHRDEYGRIIGESETYSDGTTVHRDEYGRIIGESETYSDGTTVHRDEYGRITGESY